MLSANWESSSLVSLSDKSSCFPSLSTTTGIVSGVSTGTLANILLTLSGLCSWQHEHVIHLPLSLMNACFRLCSLIRGATNFWALKRLADELEKHMIWGLRYLRSNFSGSSLGLIVDVHRVALNVGAQNGPLVVVEVVKCLLVEFFGLWRIELDETVELVLTIVELCVELPDNLGTKVYLGIPAQQQISPIDSLVESNRYRQPFKASNLSCCFVGLIVVVVLCNLDPSLIE